MPDIDQLQEELSEAQELVLRLTKSAATYRSLYERLMKPCTAMALYASRNAMEFWRAFAEIKQVLEAADALGKTR
jgi:hypothetical protein